MKTGYSSATNVHTGAYGLCAPCYELLLQLPSSLTLCFKKVFKPFAVPARRGLDFYSMQSEDFCRAASLLQVPRRSSKYESTTIISYYYCNVL